MYKCCMHKNYGKFSARKHNIDAFSDSNDARFELTMCPAFEKASQKVYLYSQDCAATMDSAYNLQRTEKVYYDDDPTSYRA